MVSYYNHPFAMYQKNHSAGSNLPYSPSSSAAAWYSSNYHHQPPNAAQFLGEADGPPQPVYYPHHVFHQSSPDWAGHENYAGPPGSGQTGSLLQGPGPGGANNAAGFLSINQATQNGNVGSHEHLGDGLQSLPSPPITVSGSDMSSPGAPNGSSSPHIGSRPAPVKSPYEWMKKPSYQSQPNPGKRFDRSHSPLRSGFVRPHTDPHRPARLSVHSRSPLMALDGRTGEKWARGGLIRVNLCPRARPSRVHTNLRLFPCIPLDQAASASAQHHRSKISRWRFTVRTPPTHSLTYRARSLDQQSPA